MVWDFVQVDCNESVFYTGRTLKDKALKINKKKSKACEILQLAVLWNQNEEIKNKKLHPFWFYKELSTWLKQSRRLEEILTQYRQISVRIYHLHFQAMFWI